jgi:hypothetical protein
VRRVRWSWLAVAFVVLVGLYFVADVVILRYIESRGAAQLAQTFDAESATADLGTVPFLPSFFSGHLHQVSGHISGASAPGGLRIDKIDITLDDVGFSPRHLVSLARSRFSARTNVKAVQANVTLQLNERDIHDYLVSKVSSVRGVRVTSSGVAVMFNEPAPPGTYTLPSPSPTPSGSPSPSATPAPPPTPPPSMARFLPRVVDGVFQFVLVSQVNVAYDLRGDALQIEELVRLPRLPQALRSDVRLGDGVVVVEAVGRDVEMNVGEAQR